jgi:hypothetical protein
VRECGGQDDQRRGQNGPFEQFHAGLPFREAPGRNNGTHHDIVPIIEERCAVI